MTVQPVFLDYNGTTPVAPEVVEAMWPYLTEHFGNPSSPTSQGRLARRAVEYARERVATLIDAHPDEITFTSGGTEANNLAIRGAAQVASQRSAVTSMVEHPATVEPLSLLEQQGWAIQRLGVDSHARIDPDAVPSGPLGLGTLILAQNEVGTIQPVAQFAQQVRSAGGVVHTDGAQAVGKIPVSVKNLHVDLLSIAGHKLYAPKGIGALFIRRGTLIDPVLLGAGQERGLRPGTENVASIVGLGVAAELAMSFMVHEAERQQQLTEMLWCQLKSAIPEIVRISPTEQCLPNTLMVALPDRIGSDLLDTVDDVAVSTGSACHSGVHTPAQTLLEMGIQPNVALGALRLSIGRQTSQSDILTVVTTLSDAAHKQP